MSISFTQFMRPNGKQVLLTVNTTPEVEAIANKVIEAGGRFTVEQLMSGLVSLAVEYSYDHEVGDIAIELYNNGPAATEAIDKLVAKAWKRIQELKGIKTP